MVIFRDFLFSLDKATFCIITINMLDKDFV